MNHSRFWHLARILRHICRATFSRNPEVRYGSRFVLAGYFANKLGFQIYNRNLHWVNDDEYFKTWDTFPNAETGNHDRRYVLYSFARALANLPGDTAECGVLEGASSFLMCHARGTKLHSLHHVFDSFQGLSEPEVDDEPTDELALGWSKNDLAVSLEVVKKSLSQFDFIRYYEGWIPERFPEVADRMFSLVHIDVDLYQPTRDALEFFYPRTVPGGAILCDDYGSTRCPGARKAFDTFLQDKPEQPIELATGQGVVIKRN